MARAPVLSDARLAMDVIPLDDVSSLVHGRHGWFLANRLDHYLGRALIRYGEYAEIEHRFLESFLSEGDYVVEVGSNIGAHTVGFTRPVGPRGHVIAIEPQPEIFRVLCANLALNAIYNVTPFALGCGARTDTMYIPRFDYRAALHNSGGVSLARSGDVAISVVTLDDLLEHVPRIRLLKIDVEGMEADVLEGATNVIAKHRPLLYVENDRANQDALIDRIRDAGYRLWWHRPALFNPDNHFHVSENEYPNVVSANMLCQPEEVSKEIVLEEITRF